MVTTGASINTSTNSIRSPHSLPFVKLKRVFVTSLAISTMSGELEVYRSMIASLSSSICCSTSTTSYRDLVDQIDALELKVYPLMSDFPDIRSSMEVFPKEWVFKDAHLGSGASFNVYSGKLIETKQEARTTFTFGCVGAEGEAEATSRIDERKETRVVAMKESVQSIHKSGNRSIVLRKILTELRIMGNLRNHTGFVNLFGIAFKEVGDEVNPILIVELALGDLDVFCRTFRSEVTWDLKTAFAVELSDALHALHACGIIHADIKCENVLVFPSTEPGVGFLAKLSDFGSCTSISAAAETLAPGTRAYLPPECLDSSDLDFPHRVTQREYGNSCQRDIYSLGLVIWALATEDRGFIKQPFRNLDLADMVLIKYDGEDSAIEYLLNQVAEDTPQRVLDVLRGMLKSNPKERISLQKVIEGLDWPSDGKYQNEHVHSPVPHLDEIYPRRPTELHLLKVPSSVRARLFAEYAAKQDTDVTAKIRLAYCYILNFGMNPLENRVEIAWTLLRDAAIIHGPFGLPSTGASEMSPFDTMIDLGDWEGILQIIRGPYSHQDMLRCICDYGWEKILDGACWASEDAAIAIIELLVEGGVTLSRASGNGLIALHYAAFTGKHMALSLLLQNGIPVDVAGPNGGTALLFCSGAVELPDDASITVAKVLLKYNAQIDKPGPNELTALLLAVERAKPQLVTLLVENGANVNYAQPSCGISPLHACARCKDIPIGLTMARTLLRKENIQLDLRHTDGSTPFAFAIEENNPEFVSLLLDHHACLNIPTQSCHLLFFAVAMADKFSDTRIVELLLKQGASIEETAAENLTAFHLAVTRGNITLMELLLQHKASVFARSSLQETPLHMCISYTPYEKLVETVTVLVQNGAQIEATDDKGCTPLHLACLLGEAESNQPLMDTIISTLRVLLLHGASVDEAVVDRVHAIGDKDLIDLLTVGSSVHEDVSVVGLEWVSGKSEKLVDAVSTQGDHPL